MLDWFRGLRLVRRLCEFRKEAQNVTVRVDVAVVFEFARLFIHFAVIPRLMDVSVPDVI